MTSEKGDLLSVRGIVKHFGGVYAVQDCSFGVRPGSITGLIGPNGAGKSTLFNLVTGVLRADAGEIRFEGQHISGLGPSQVARRGVGRTFQTPRLFYSMTAWENLMLAGSEARSETVRDALWRPKRNRDKEARSSQRAHDLLAFLELSHLTNTLAASLSGGQRKLLTLGRVLMMEPRLILLDEPAAGVNETLTRTLMARIQEVNTRGVTFLIVEHDMDLIMSLCDSVVVMHQGRVLLVSTAQEVQQNPEVMTAYLGGTV